MTPTLAIDFGTSNTVLAVWNPATGQADTVRLPAISLPPLDGAPPLVPSALYLEGPTDAQVVVGQAARDRLTASGDRQRYFQAFKRGIVSDGPGFTPSLDGRDVTPQRLGALYLRAVLGAFRQVGQSPSQLVVTAPVQAFEPYMAWLRGVLAEDLDCSVHVLDEPTAAAIGYGIRQSDLPILVVDFGGGTLDVSLVRMAETPLPQSVSQTASLPGVSRQATVLGKAGCDLGGEDIDTWLVDDFLASQGSHPGAHLIDLPTLRGLAERLKIRLSQALEADFVFFDPETARTLRRHYHRETFEELLERRDFFVRLQATLDAVLREGARHGVMAADIGAVLLVGGTTLIPAVARSVRQRFPRDRVHVHAPFEAVAHGAAAALEGVQLQDHLYHGYGVRYWDPQARKHAYQPLLLPGQVYPMTDCIELTLQASRAGQPAIELIIGEMAPPEDGPSEVVFEGGRLVAAPANRPETTILPLNASPEGRTIARLEPPGQPGTDRIRVQFRVDADRHLRLSVFDMLTERLLMNDQPVVRLR